VAGASGVQSAAVGSSLRVAGLGGGSTDYASFYEFTRQIADGVDDGTFQIVSAIAAVTSYPPSSVNDAEATWGPGGDALDPVNWRVTVTQVGTGEFDYEVDGRPHGDTNDADFKAIVTGHGYGKSHPSYRSGTLTVFGDVLAALDPTQSSGGTAKITYDARTLPRTVTADITTSDGSGQWYDASVTHAADGSGVLVLTALADVSNPKDGKNESVDENSRWDPSGAGRADIEMSGGDFGSTVVKASQCWSTTFAQSYYTDNVSYQPTAGDPAACVFAQAQFDQ
jgi:predicted RecA/RadA family phage recombinase